MAPPSVAIVDEVFGGSLGFMEDDEEEVGLLLLLLLLGMMIPPVGIDGICIPGGSVGFMKASVPPKIP